MEISVIVTTYNRAKVLLRALDSILEQIFCGVEILVVDDGSTDETKKTLKNKYPKIQYFYQENKGVSAARNMGIIQARSEWLAFLDSDDEWLPRKLQTQVDALKINDKYKFCHTEEIWIRNGMRVNPMKKHQKFGGWIYQKCLPLCVISPSSTLIHRSVFEDVGLFDETLPVCEDYDLWLRICLKYPVLFLEQPLIVKYGGHEDQLSQRFVSMDRFRIRALGNILNDVALKALDRNATIAMLLKKAEIYRNGAEKRGKTSEVEKMNQIINKHREQA